MHVFRLHSNDVYLAGTFVLVVYRKRICIRNVLHSNGKCLTTKRLGRYHNVPRNNNNDKSNLQSYFSEVAFLYNDNSKKSSPDWSKPAFGQKRSSLQKVLANANKAIEKSTKFINKI